MLKFEDILSAARTRTELPDPSGDAWREGLEILLRDHAGAGNLTERGRDMLAGRYTEALAARMRVDDYIRHRPRLADAPVKRPVFILDVTRAPANVNSERVLGVSRETALDRTSSWPVAA